MSLSVLDRDAIVEESTSASINKFLLLETQIIEDDDYETPGNDADSLPVARDIVEILREIDLNTTRDWLWQNTSLNDHYDRGPILVEIEQDSPLLAYFWDKICSIDAGILINTNYSRAELLQHLRSIMTVLLPNDDVAQLKIQTPVKLAGLMGAFNDLRLSTYLGPIKNIYWIENCGAEKHSFKVTNPSEHPPRQSSPKWFKLSKEELQHLNEYDSTYFKRNIMSLLMSHIDQGEFRGKNLSHLDNIETSELEEIIYKGMQSGKQLNIDDESNLSNFIILNILDPYFFKQENIAQLIGNTHISGRERMSRIQQLMDLQG